MVLVRWSKCRGTIGSRENKSVTEVPLSEYAKMNSIHAVALVIIGFLCAVEVRCQDQPLPARCQVSNMEALRVKEQAVSRISAPAFNITSDLNAHNWYMQVAGAFDADAKFVYDVLEAAGTEPPTYRIGFLFWGIEVMASTRQWHDKSQAALGDDGYSWIIIPCSSACDGDIIAGPAYFADQADVVLGMVQKYMDGIPETVADLVNRLMQTTRVAVVTDAVSAGSEREKQVVMPDIMSQQVARSDWAFRWFGNITRQGMYTCRRLITAL